MYVQRITAESIAVSGTGSAAVTTITVPADTVFAAGCMYDILLSAQVPSETDGTIVAISNGTVSGEIMQGFTGNYARARALGWRKVIRVQFFADPDHFNLMGVRS